MKDNNIFYDDIDGIINMLSYYLMLVNNLNMKLDQFWIYDHGLIIKIIEKIPPTCILCQ